MIHELQFRFGGIWGVGKAAENLPALVVLSYKPTGASKTIAMVGKGIVYDTGGLSIKSSAGMPTMKCDMAGSAAILGTYFSLKGRISTCFSCIRGCSITWYAIQPTRSLVSSRKFSICAFI